MYSLHRHSARCRYDQANRGIASRGEHGVYYHSEKVGLYKERGQDSGVQDPCILGLQGSEAEAYAGSNNEEKDERSVSDQEATILRSAEILCIISSELGAMAVDGLLELMHLASFDLNAFWDAMQ